MFADEIMEVLQTQREMYKNTSEEENNNYIHNQIMNFCAEYPVIVSPVVDTSKPIDIITQNPKEVSVELTNYLYLKLNVPWVEMRPVLPGQRYSIFIDTRKVVDILAIQVVGTDGVYYSDMNIMRPIGSGDLTWTPPEFVLMRMSKIMYSLETDETDKNDMKPLFDKQVVKLLARLKSKVYLDVKDPGGNDKLVKAFKDHSDMYIGGKNKRDNTASISLRLDLLRFISQDCIIIGHWALVQTVLRFPARHYREISVIVDDIDEFYVKIKEFFKLRGIETNIKYKGVFRAIDDFRLSKSSIFIKLDNKWITYIAMFNSGKYEVLPYFMSRGSQVGVFHILLRFCLIEFWIGRIIYLATGKIPFFLNDIMSELEILCTSTFATSRLYFGRYRLERVDLDKERQKNIRELQKYQPHIFKKKFGRLRQEFIRVKS